MYHIVGTLHVMLGFLLYFSYNSRANLAQYLCPILATQVDSYHEIMRVPRLTSTQPMIWSSIRNIANLLGEAFLFKPARLDLQGVRTVLTVRLLAVGLWYPWYVVYYWNFLNNWDTCTKRTSVGPFTWYYIGYSLAIYLIVVQRFWFWCTGV